MTAQNFDRCLAAILAHEGGFVDHKADPGGATNLGVTLDVMREAGLDVDGDGDVDVQDVRKLTPAKAAALYRAKYWRATDCDDLPDGLDYMVFDTAVNMGPRRARDYLQIAACVKRDGIIGKQTLDAVHAMGVRRTIYAIELLRKNFYHASPNFPTFGKGWLRRLDEVASQALRWS